MKFAIASEKQPYFRAQHPARCLDTKARQKPPASIHAQEKRKPPTLDESVGGTTAQGRLLYLYIM
nr:MAG TPA: hypothetical protein [Caudoviricetes sp.]